MKLFDAHFHIIDFQFKVVENNGYLPPEFTIADYQDATKDLEIVGGAIVSGSFQAFDQEYLKNALNRMGNGFFGVANIPYSISDEELEVLNQHNIKAVRFNLKRGGSESVDHLEYLSNRLYDEYGWHTELYVDSNDLRELKPSLEKLNSFSIDHLGLSKEGLEDLLFWVEKGVRIKATGFGRIDFDPIMAMRRINEVNPHALMFGTDLPSTRAGVPFSIRDIELIQGHFDEKAQALIFYQNALEWYGIG